MSLPSSFKNDISALLRPSILLGMAIHHFMMTIFEVAFKEGQPTKLFKLTELRYKSFARLWAANGERMSIEMPPLLDTLLKSSSGVVLDVGPGSGELLSRFNHSNITAIYGAEPAADLHPGLLRNAAANNFEGKYHALLCGAEPESLIPALHKSGLLQDGAADNGVFDEICCIRVLCGVPRPRETLKGLYKLLKPGGRMVVCEHVVNPWRTEGRVLARVMQVVYTCLGWPFFMGGCELQRSTDVYLKEAGEWDKFSLEYVEPHHAVPFIVGELIKASPK